MTNSSEYIISHMDRLRKIVNRYAIYSSSSDDIFQECLFRIIKKQEVIDDKKQVPSYLNMVVKNCVINENVKRKRNIDNIGKYIENKAGDEESYKEDLREEIEFLYANLHVLTDFQRKILDLKLSGLNGSQIAEKLGVCGSTVSKAMTRVVKKLKKQFGDKFEAKEVIRKT